MNANRLVKSLLAGALLAVASGGAWAGIATTKHNLSSGGTGTNTFDGTDQICVFCHTPHGADTSANPPLWNRALTGLGPYTTYDSLGTSTLDGEVLTVGSVSIACLSCHDGTQAMNVMINAPGSGNYDPAGFTLSGTWTGPAAGADPVGSLNYAIANNIVNLTEDLRNDHPIGIEYGGGGCYGASPCNTTTDPDFKQIVKNANGDWFVDVDNDGNREKTDMILYTRTFASGAGPSVECASCHDPHTGNATFLRISNAASAVCLACHDK